MRIRMLMGGAVLCAGLASPLLAAPAGSKPPAAARVASGAKPASAAAARTPAAGTTAAKGGPRTLDDIHIEGEIEVPQVLFIAARDQRRFVDFQHQRYLMNGRQLGESTVRPMWIAVTRTQPNAARKEMAP